MNDSFGLSGSARGEENLGNVIRFRRVPVDCSVFCKGDVEKWEGLDIGQVRSSCAVEQKRAIGRLHEPLGQPRRGSIIYRNGDRSNQLHCPKSGQPLRSVLGPEGHAIAPANTVVGQPRRGAFDMASQRFVGPPPRTAPSDKADGLAAAHPPAGFENVKQAVDHQSDFSMTVPSSRYQRSFP